MPIPAIVAIVIAAIVLLFIIVVAMQSRDFRFARSTTVDAPPSAVFAQVNDFHRWDAWSPWAKIDPQMKQTFEGAPAGNGAVYSWTGNKKVGEGRMTIVESHPSDLVRIKLEFMKPFTATNIAEFTFVPQGSQTLVTWGMTGERNFMFKAVHLLMNMEKMIGKEFDKGLADMKRAAEAAKDCGHH